MRTGSAFAAAVVALCLSAAPAGAATGNIFTIAGTGTPGYTGDGGPASAAQVAQPVMVRTAPDGSYFILDHGNDTARLVSPNGIITTVAGTGQVLQNFNGDNIAATSAHLSAPNGIGQLLDGSYLISSSNHYRVRRVINGVITTAIGNGTNTSTGDGFPATSATINFPSGIAVRPDGSYLVADADGHRIRQVDAGGTITTVANTSGIAGSAGDGLPATDAAVRLNRPSDVALTADGGYLITEFTGNRVRKVDANGTITTVAGTGAAGFSGDGGPATAAQLNQPYGIAAMPDGGFVFADIANSRVRRVLPDGTITTLAGTGTDGYNGDGIPAATAQLSDPSGTAVTPEGDVLIADGTNARVRLVDLGDPPPPPPPPPADRPSSVTLNADNVGNRRPGTPLTVAGTVVLQSGAPAANRQLRYAITGANPDGGVLTADASGVARHTWDGLRDGADTFVMYADLNNNGLQDAGEPFDRATVTWVLPAPVIAKRANIEPVSGRVLVKLPASSSRKRDPDLVAAQSKFIPLEEARSIPFGSIIDTRAGRAEITSAASSRTQQAAQFYNGNFELLQTKGARPITEIRMNEALVCPRAGSKQVVPARARSRQLWGNGKGRFRTRGRNSSASVRGTIWWNKDTCTTTTTVVREGTVIVRDFGKKKNIRVKAPGRYVARAKKKTRR